MHLHRQRFEVYLPRYLKLQRHAKSDQNHHGAVVSRYIFVAVDLEMQRWRAIQSRSVERLVCSGEYPIAAAEGRQSRGSNPARTNRV